MNCDLWGRKQLINVCYFVLSLADLFPFSVSSLTVYRRKQKTPSAFFVDMQVFARFSHFYLTFLMRQFKMNINMF